MLKTADDFGERCGALTDWSYDCVDRIVLNGRFNFACSPGGFRTWWREFFGNDKNLNDASIRRFAWDVGRSVRKYCATNKIDFLECDSSTRKDDIAAAYVKRAEESGKRGVFLVLAGKAPAPIWRVKQNKEGKIINLEYKKPWPFVKHYSFHILDDRWGHIVVKMCGYPPFGLQIILNGHNWVEARIREKGVAFTMDDNCFTGGDENEIQRLCTRLFGKAGGRQLEKVCEKWGYWCLGMFAIQEQEVSRTGFRYWWSVYQLEVSRNYHFTSPAALDEVYQSIIDMTRRRLDIPRMRTIFGVRSRPHQRKNRAALTGGRGRRDAVSTSVDTPEYNLTVFKTRWANRTLKLYDKGRHTLRGESVIHNARALKVKRGLDNWTEVVRLMHESLIRFFNALDSLNSGLVDAGRLDSWRKPVKVGKSRLAGITMEKPRMRALINSITELSVHNKKVTRNELAIRTDRRLKASGGYTVRQASYDMRKLRAKGLLDAKPRQKKYTVNLNKLRELTGVLAIRDKVLKKVCVLSSCYIPSGKPDKVTITECYDDLGRSLANMFGVLHLYAEA